MQSFYAPYLCESCGTSFQAVIDAHLHRNAVKTRTPPAVVCPSCGSDARFDGVLTSFATSAEQLENASTLVGRSDLEQKVSPPPPPPSNLPRRLKGGATHIVLQGELSSSVRWRSGMDGIEGAVVLDLTEATGVGPGALAPLQTALRSPPPEVTSLTIRGAPLALVRALRVSPDERLVVASVVVEGHCASCNAIRRAIVEVDPSKGDQNFARGAKCPKHKTPLVVNRTLQDVPKRRVPIQTMLVGSGVLAGIAVIVVVVAAAIAAFSPGPGESGADQAAATFTLDERQVTVRGRGGPLGMEEEARRAAKLAAVGELMSGLNREIGDRRGVSAGALVVSQAEADRFLAGLGDNEQPTEVDAVVREVDGGVTVDATYGLSRGAFDGLAKRYAEDRSWGGMTLLIPFPPADGLSVVKSDLAGVEAGMRVVKIGPEPVVSFDQLPVTPSGALVTVVDRDGSQKEIRVP